MFKIGDEVIIRKTHEQATVLGFGRQDSTTYYYLDGYGGGYEAHDLILAPKAEVAGKTFKPGDKVRIVMPCRTGTVLKIEDGMVKVEEPNGGTLWWLEECVELDGPIGRTLNTVKNFFKESEVY
jgi:hypothetical protein